MIDKEGYRENVAIVIINKDRKVLWAKRASENGGVDPLKQKYYNNYSKERNGAKHPDQVKQTYESKNVKIDFD